MKHKFCLLGRARPTGLIVALTAVFLTAAPWARAQVLRACRHSPTETACGIPGGGMLISDVRQDLLADDESMDGEIVECESPALGDSQDDPAPGEQPRAGAHRRGKTKDSAWLAFFFGLTGLAGAEAFNSHGSPHEIIARSEGFIVTLGNLPGGMQSPSVSLLNPPTMTGTVVCGELPVRKISAGNVPEPGSVAMLVGVGIVGSLMAVRLRKRR